MYFSEIISSYFKLVSHLVIQYANVSLCVCVDMNKHLLASYADSLQALIHQKWEHIQRLQMSSKVL